MDALSTKSGVYCRIWLPTPLLVFLLAAGAETLAGCSSSDQANKRQGALGAASEADSASTESTGASLGSGSNDTGTTANTAPKTGPAASDATESPSTPLSQSDFYSAPSATIAVNQGGGTIDGLTGVDLIDRSCANPPPASCAGVVDIYAWRNKITGARIYIPFSPDTCLAGDGTLLACGDDILDMQAWMFEAYLFSVPSREQLFAKQTAISTFWRFSDPRSGLVVYTNRSDMDDKLAAHGYTVKQIAPFVAMNDRSIGLLGLSLSTLTWRQDVSLSAAWKLGLPDSCLDPNVNEASLTPLQISENCRAKDSTFGGVLGYVFNRMP